MLEYKVDSIDGIDESLVDYYEADDNGDGYVLKVGGLPSFDDPVDLKNTLKKVRIERKTIEKDKKNIAREFEEFKQQYSDIDVDEYKALKKTHEEMQKKEALRQQEEAKKRGEWETLEAQLHERYKTEQESLSKKMEAQIIAKENKLSEMNKRLNEYMVNNEISEAVSNAKGKLKILKPHIEPFVRVVEDDGEFVPRVMNEKNEIRLNEDGEPMTVSQFVLELRESPDFESTGIFEREIKKGGVDSEGNRSPSQSPSSKNPWKTDSINFTEQALILKNDPKRAEKLMREAGL